MSNFNQNILFLSMEVDILVDLKSDGLIMLEEACIAMSMGKANFSSKNWLKSPSLERHPRLKGNKILKVAY